MRKHYFYYFIKWKFFLDFKNSWKSFFNILTRDFIKEFHRWNLNKFEKSRRIHFVELLRWFCVDFVEFVFWNYALFCSELSCCFGFRFGLNWKVCCLWKCNGWTSWFLFVLFDFIVIGSADLVIKGGILSRVRRVIGVSPFASYIYWGLAPFRVP